MGYYDFDLCGDLGKRISLIDYCFTLFGNVISWKALLQSVVALSTTKAEFMALTKATKEALWL